MENEKIKNTDKKQYGKLITLVLKYKTVLIQFLKYNFIGLLNTGIDVGLVFLFQDLLSFPYEAAKPIAYTVGIVNSFIMNKFWTFKKKAQVLKGVEIIKFIIVNLITLGASMVITRLLNTYLGLSTTIGNMFVIPVAIVINFTLYKFWIFKSREM